MTYARRRHIAGTRFPLGVFGIPLNGRWLVCLLIEFFLVLDMNCSAVAPFPIDSAPTIRVVVRLGNNDLVHQDLDTLAFSPDARYLASGGGEQLIVWSIPYGRPVFVAREEPSNFGVSALCYSPNGRWLVSAGAQVRVRDAATGKVVHVLSEVGGGKSRLAISADSQLLAVAGNHLHHVYLFDLVTGKQKGKLRHSFPYLSGLAFHPTRKLLAFCGLDSPAVDVWSVDSGIKVRTVSPLPGQPIQSLSWSSDGSHLLCGAADRDVVVTWNWAKNQARSVVNLSRLGRNSSKSGGIYAIHINQQGTAVITTSAQGSSLWTLQNGKPVGGSVFDQERAGVFSPNGRFIATVRCCHLITIYEKKEGGMYRPGSVARNPIRRAIFSPKEDRILIEDSGVALWSVSAKTPTSRRLTNNHCLVAISHDSRRVATVDSQGISLWDLSDGRCVRSFPHAGHPILAVAFSPRDDALLAIEHREAQDREQSNLTITRWSVKKGTCTQRDLFHPETVHPTEALVAVFSRSGRATAWLDRRFRPIVVSDLAERPLRLSTMKLPPTPGENEAPVICFAPGGRMLVLVSNRILFLPDSNASGDKQVIKPSVMLFEVASGAHRRTLELDPPDLTSLTVSPHGDLFASGHKDGQLFLWDLHTARRLASSRAHRAALTSLSFSGSGSQLLSGSEDSTALLSDVSQVQVLWRRTHSSAPVCEEEFEKWWNQLAGNDAAKAYEAIENFALRPRETIALFAKKLTPAQRVTDGDLRHLIHQLGANNYTARQCADQKIREQGSRAIPLLHATLREKPDLDLTLRIERILAILNKQQLPGEDLRVMRAMEVLEHVASPAAKRLVRQLAGGAPGSRLTEEAKRSLMYLSLENN